MCVYVVVNENHSKHQNNNKHPTMKNMNSIPCEIEMRHAHGNTPEKGCTTLGMFSCSLKISFELSTCRKRTTVDLCVRNEREREREKR